MSGKIVVQVRELALPQHEKYVALMLASYADGDGGSIFPSVAQLARLTGYSDRRVQQILRALQARGIIAPVANAQGGRGKTTRYQMYPEKGEVLPPLECDEKGEISSIKGEMDEAGFTLLVSQRVKPGTQKGETGDEKGEISSIKGEIAVSPDSSDKTRQKDQSRDQSVDAASAAPPPPPPVSPARKPVTEQQAEVGAWARVMDLDISIPANAKRVGNMLKGLRHSKVAQPTVSVAEAHWMRDAIPGCWNFYRDTWQGQRGNKPTEREINQYWGDWLKPAANSNGHGPPARAAPSTAQQKADANLAIIARLTDPDPPPDNVIEGRFRHGK